MASLSSISDSDLLGRMPGLVLAERAATADVIEHLVEIDGRKLYLDQACSSLTGYCIERLGYSEDGALKRVRVARLVKEFPFVLEELRRGAIHLTGLFLLSTHMTGENAEALLTEARGKTRRELEKLLARCFPRPDVQSMIQPVLPSAGTNALGSVGSTGRSTAFTCPRPGATQVRSKLEPLSVSSYRVEFTASAELYAKLERARELSSHALPGGELASVIERALDALIESETRRRTGAGKPRKKRPLKPGSRHVPRDVARIVWERDGGQCTFVDADGRRCSERRFVTLEHRLPFALGGPPTADNICLLCSSHNGHAARQVFGERYPEQKRTERTLHAEHATQTQPTPPIENAPDLTRSGSPGQGPPSDVYTKVHSALCHMGFRKQQASRALNDLCAREFHSECEPLLRAALQLLVPAPARAS